MGLYLGQKSKVLEVVTQVIFCISLIVCLIEGDEALEGRTEAYKWAWTHTNCLQNEDFTFNN